MKITVNKNELLSKLREKLRNLDNYDQLMLDMSRRREGAEKEAVKKAIAALKSGVGFTVKFYDGYGFHSKSDGNVEIRFDMAVPKETIPADPDKFKIADVEALKQAIQILEMSTDEELVVTEKDNYFKYL